MRRSSVSPVCPCVRYTTHMQVRTMTVGTNTKVNTYVNTYVSNPFSSPAPGYGSVTYSKRLGDANCFRFKTNESRNTFSPARIICFFLLIRLICLVYFLYLSVLLSFAFPGLDTVTVRINSILALPLLSYPFLACGVV